VFVAGCQKGGRSLVLRFLEHHHAADEIYFALEVRLVLVNQRDRVLEKRRC
jgi:hypothetical protein